VVLATEAYTSQLAGCRRDVVPLYSLMVGSRPLSPAQWDAVGLGDRPTFHDARHLTLADLITGRDTELVGLPWVGHRSRRWEPEPLRWIGVNLGRLAAARADRAEASSSRAARWRAGGWRRLLATLT
jgi:hypothetical protein